MSKKYNYIKDNCIKSFKMDLIKKFKNLCFKEYWENFKYIKIMEEVCCWY